MSYNYDRRNQQAYTERSSGTRLDRTSHSHLTSAQIAEHLLKSANRLYSHRSELHGDYDILHDAYSDATGLVTQGLYEDPDVQATMNMVEQVSHQLMTAAQHMEHLARLIKSGKKG
jgi:hypothetical protein